MSATSQDVDEAIAFVRQVAQSGAQVLAPGAFKAHAFDAKSAAIDLVTDFDRRAEKAVIDTIAARFPSDVILAEEGGLRAGRTGRRWIVDPLDGTTNFAHGLPFFCVSVALEEAGVVTVGAIEAPALGWSFWGARGRGAWLERAGSPPTKLTVSPTAQLGRALLGTGFPYDNATSPANNFAEFVALYPQTQGVRRVGAAALDLCMVAAGWLDGYWEMKLKPWDSAAGALFVAEAGGQVTNWSGGALDLDDGFCLASNGRVHEQLVAAIAAAR